MSRVTLKKNVADEAELAAFAATFAPALRPPLVVYLDGPLGAGKTTFVRALLKALGYPGRVKSPTYGLMERYDLKGFSIVHLDLYRVEDEAEIDYLAVRDLFGDRTVLLIEWPGRGGDSIPPADVEVRFSESVSKRSLALVAKSAAGETLVSSISG